MVNLDPLPTLNTLICDVQYFVDEEYHLWKFDGYHYTDLTKAYNEAVKVAEKG